MLSVGVVLFYLLSEFSECEFACLVVGFENVQQLHVVVVVELCEQVPAEFEGREKRLVGLLHLPMLHGDNVALAVN